MMQEVSTGFVGMINCPNLPQYLLAKDTNGDVYVRSDCIGVGRGISAPYSIALAMGVLFGFGIRDKKVVLIEVPIPQPLMRWLKSQHIMNLVHSITND